MNANISGGKKTSPEETPAFPLKTSDKATEQWGGPLIFEQGVADMQESVLWERLLDQPRQGSVSLHWDQNSLSSGRWNYSLQLFKGKYKNREKNQK